MKNKFSIILLLFSVIIFSQNDKSSKWTSSVFIDLNASNNSSYSYYDLDNKPKDVSVDGKGSVELVYNIDYKIFNKLSATATAGLTNFNGPLLASIKTGLGLKLIYTPDFNYNYLTLQYGYHSPFSRKQFREGHQIKIGQVFDVVEIFNKRLLVGIFYNYDFFYMDNAKTLRSYASKSISYKTTSYGISIGIKF